MFGKILSSPLKPVATCGKNTISDIWQGFEFVFLAITCFRKSVSSIILLCTDNPIDVMFGIFAE